MNEEAEEPKLKPVYPKSPDFHTLILSKGYRNGSKRASRRLKFLGLEEYTPPLGTSGGNEDFVHGDTLYDMATGPRPPRVRRPNLEEWGEPIISTDDTETMEKVTDARKTLKDKRLHLDRVKKYSDKKK